MMTESSNKYEDVTRLPGSTVHVLVLLPNLQAADYFKHFRIWSSMGVNIEILGFERESFSRSIEGYKYRSLGQVGPRK